MVGCEHRSPTSTLSQNGSGDSCWKSAVQTVLLEETGVPTVLVAPGALNTQSLKNMFIATFRGVHTTRFHILQREWVCIDHQAPSTAGVHAIGW